MRCQDALELFSSHLDGELTAAEVAPLQQHLETCPACRQQQELHRRRRRPPACPLPARHPPARGSARPASPAASPVPPPPPRRRASPLAFAVAFTGAAAAAAAIAIAGPTTPPETTAGAPATAATNPATVAPAAAAADPAAILADASEPTAGRLRNQVRNRLRSNDCRHAAVSAASSPVARACKTGGTAAATRTMRALVNAGRARGLRLDCRSCHTDLDTFQLDTGARERFARLLAVDRRLTTHTAEFPCGFAPLDDSPPAPIDRK